MLDTRHVYTAKKHMRRKLHFSNECFKHGGAAAKCKRITLTHYRVSFNGLGCKFRRRRKKKKINKVRKRNASIRQNLRPACPKTSRPKKDGDALIFPPEFFASRSSPISRYRALSTRDFMKRDRDCHESRLRFAFVCSILSLCGTMSLYNVTFLYSFFYFFLHAF